MRRPLSLIAVLLGALCGVSAGLAGAHASDMQLPAGVEPVLYRLRIEPDLEAGRFLGRAEIEIDMAAPAAELTLNALGLEFERVEADGAGAPAAVALDPVRQEATFRFAAPLAAGRHTLRIAYRGAIGGDGHGLYLSRHAGAAGTGRMLVTQFEPVDARRVFPAWDEPGRKAEFEVTVIVPEGFLAVSNMPVAREAALAPGRKEVAFQRTPRMSTYLLVLAAGELERIAERVGAVELGAVVPKGQSAKARWALRSMVRLLPYYNAYYGVDYPLPKLDLIAAGDNFSFGAMENWGAMTFIDSLVLLDPATSSAATRENIFVVIAHEMAHQWTGNLVTMRWWDDIWLNEGFAQWMNYKAADALNPNWRLYERGSFARRATARDASRSAHAVYQPVREVSETDTIFDGITYDKGAAVLRMLEAYLGADIFRDGIRRYMAAHAYGNAASADLWEALTAASGEPVASIAEGFVMQPGLPDIRVEQACVEGRLRVRLEQRRFTIHYPDAPAASWRVPVLVGRPGEGPRKLLLDTAPASLEFPDCASPAKANLGDLGYYHATYDGEGLARLGAAFAGFAPADRGNLLDDAWGMVASGKAPLATWLDLASHAASDESAAVLNLVLDTVGWVDTVLRATAERDAFRAEARRLLAPAMARLGWAARPGEDEIAPLLRERVITTLGTLGDAAILDEGRRRFAAFPGDPAAMPGPIAGAVTRIVGRAADHAAFERLLRLARAAPDFESRERYFGALMGVLDPELASAALAVTLGDDYPRARIGRLLGAVATRGEHPDLAWAFLLKNEQALYERLADTARNWLGPVIAAGFDDLSGAAALRAYAPANATPGGRINVTQTVDGIETKAELKARLTAEIRAWPAPPKPR